jgi:acyl transferase domain-containing protein
VEISCPTSKAVSVAFLFTSQASQYIAIGHQLFDTSASFRDKLKLLDTICHKLGFLLILNVFLDIKSKTLTSDLVVFQLALIAIEVVLVEL